MTVLSWATLIWAARDSPWPKLLVLNLPFQSLLPLCSTVSLSHIHILSLSLSVRFHLHLPRLLISWLPFSFFFFLYFILLVFPLFSFSRLLPISPLSLSFSLSLSLSLSFSLSIPLLLIWFLLLSKVTCGEQPLCCIQRERGGSTPGWEWKTLNWNICQATDYMIAAPLRHSGSCCLKSREHKTTSPLEQRGHTESNQ